MDQTRSMQRKDYTSAAVRALGYTSISFFSLCCIVPFFLVLATSLTSESSITKFGYNLWPKEFSTFAYHIVFENPGLIVGSYVVTMGITIIGTLVGLLIVAMTGYALQRPDFHYRNSISFFIYFTTLFSGGVVPFYLIMTQWLHLKDNYLAVLLPGLMTPFLIIMMKSFVKSIPHAITESAKMDRAGDFRIFASLILPMTAPALATIGLFIALGYWNEWYNSMLFLSPDLKYRPLQLFLYNVITSADFIKNSSVASNVQPRDMPLESMKMATAVVATGPVILFFPLIQRYFVKGITVGAVKG